MQQFGEYNVRLRDLQTAAAISLLLVGSLPQGMAQAQSPTTPAAPQSAAQAAAAASPSTIPAAPEPNLTEPLFLESSHGNFTQPKEHFPNPIAPYTSRFVPPPRLGNTPRLENLLRDGKINLSLSDAVVLALENNFDIAIARYNLDIADTDLLRAKSGNALRGVNSGLVTGTLGGSSSTITGGGGPGGTSGGSNGAGSGASGLVLSTNGAGPLPEVLDPTISGMLQLERSRTPQSFTLFNGAFLSQNIDQYNFAYNQGFLTGTALTVGFNNSRITTSSKFNVFNPILQSTFQAKVTQHLLQGFGWGLNGRFIVQAKNDRRITDSAFRQQVLYTINQVENIYWALVSAYEDEQSKVRALDQSKQLAADNRKQLDIGTLAPLDVVNADSSVATDQQALISSQTNLEYQQLIMKQAIARNLTDQALSTAPVIPTDRVSLTEVPEESMSIDDLVRQAEANNPQVEQSLIQVKNDEITLKALKNGLLPTVDLYGFYGASALGGLQNPGCTTQGSQLNGTCPSAAGYGSTVGNLFNSSAPDKGAGLSVLIPIRNRVAQADQARSQLEYRQAQMRLQQIYTQIRIQIINSQYALANDRAQVKAAMSAREFAAQSTEAERKKYRLGASTTPNVLLQQRNLAVAENNVISATAAYARDRGALSQLLANTLDRYGISLVEAASGTITKAPVIPGLEAPKPTLAPGPIGSTPPSAH